MDVGRFAGQALECLPTPFLALESVRTPSGTEDLCVVWANPAARDRFGSDLIGSWIDRDAPLGTTEPIVPETGPAGSRIGLHTVERSVHRDGATEHLRCTLVPVGDGAAMMVEDVTAEAQARAELASAGTTLARVEQWGNLGVWEVDLVTDDTYWSTQVFQILGVDEAGPRQFRGAVHPDDVPLVDHVVQRALDQPGPYRITHRIVRAGDEVRTLDQHMQSIAGADGRPVRLMGTMIDVTATHVLQNQVREAQSMRTLGMLAGGLAHDFNNVLMIVRGHADLLLNEAAGDDRMRPSLEAISRAGERASTLTRKLMALGRQEELTPAPVSPATVLGEVAALVGPAVAPDVEVDVEIAPGSESTEIVVDVDHLNQLLIDLVLNARDAKARQVRLCFGTERLSPNDPRLEEGRLAPGRYGVVQVVDDGEGMDEATRQRIFEPFFTTKDASSGSGLGLANARSFAQRSLGTLQAASEPGQGTTMSLLLPIEVAAEPSKAPHRRRRRQTRVLVAARNRMHGARLAENLESLGHQLVSVESLQAMTFSLASEPIDAVVVDGSMLTGAAVPTIENVPALVVGDAPDDAPYRTVEDDAMSLRDAVQSMLAES